MSHGSWERRKWTQPAAENRSSRLPAQHRRAADRHPKRASGSGSACRTWFKPCRRGNVPWRKPHSSEQTATTPTVLPPNITSTPQPALHVNNHLLRAVSGQPLQQGARIQMEKPLCQWLPPIACEASTLTAVDSSVFSCVFMCFPPAWWSTIISSTITEQVLLPQKWNHMKPQRDSIWHERVGIRTILGSPKSLPNN